MFGLIIFWVVTTILNLVLAQVLKPKVAKRGPGELDGPIAEQGYPVPVVFGTVRVKGPNCIWWGAYEFQGKQDDQIFDHWAVVNMAVCHGPVDRIRRLWFGDTLPCTKVASQRGGGAPVAPVNNAGVSSTTTANARPGSSTEGAVRVVGAAWAQEWADAVVGTAAEGLRPSILGWFAIYRNNGWVYLRPNGSVTLDGSLKTWSGTGWITAPAVTPTQALLLTTDHSSQKDNLKLNGVVEFWHGATGQGYSEVLKAYARGGGVTPNYDGLCHAVFYGGRSAAIAYIRTVTGGFSGSKFSMPTVGATKMPPASRPGFYWGESPVIPQVSFEVERVTDLLGLGAARYTSWTDMSSKWGTVGGFPVGKWKSDLGDLVAGRTADYAYDANPAEIVFEIVTNSDWGLGIPTSMVDVESFRDCARILAAEDFGLSILLDSQGEADDVINDVLKTVDGVYYRDPYTGLHTMRLIRKLYTAAEAAAMGIGEWYWNPDILTFTEDDVLGNIDYSRGTMSDVANEVKVQYTDRFNDYATRVVSAHDDANFAAMGDEGVTVLNVYNGVMSRELALRLAARDLKTFGYPLSRMKGEFKRKARVLRPGDRFVLDYSQTLGIAAMTFRVGDIRYGTMEDRRVAIEAVEDVFAMPDTTYVEPGSGWIDPATVVPAQPSSERAWELPYNLSPSTGYQADMTALAARGNAYTKNLFLVPLVDSIYQMDSTVEARYSPTALLTTGIAVEERTGTITLQGCVDFGGIETAPATASGQNLLLVDDELIAFQGISVDIAAGTATITGCWRGVMDTIPRAHALGARVWIVRDPGAASAGLAGSAPVLSDHEVRFSLTAGNEMAVLDVLGQPILGGNTTSRTFRPFVPGKFRVNGATDLPTSLADQVVTGNVPVAWEPRNRVTQAPGVVPQDVAGITGEASQLQRLTLYKGLGLAFRPYLPWGDEFPFGETVQFTGQPANWIDLRDTIWLDAVGIKDYGDWQVGAPGFSETLYLYISIDGAQYSNDHNGGPWTYGYDYDGAYPGRVYLFRAVFVVSGGNVSATLYDLRGAVQDAVLVDSPAATSGNITPQDVLDIGLNGLHPNRAVVDSHRDGLDSMERRESGFLFDAGWGMAWGAHWGATEAAEDTNGWGWNWGNNWGGA